MLNSIWGPFDNLRNTNGSSIIEHLMKNRDYAEKFSVEFSLYWVSHSLPLIWNYWGLFIFCQADRFSANGKSARTLYYFYIVSNTILFFLSHQKYFPHFFLIIPRDIFLDLALLSKVDIGQIDCLLFWFVGCRLFNAKFLNRQSLLFQKLLFGIST